MEYGQTGVEGPHNTFKEIWDSFI